MCTSCDDGVDRFMQRIEFPEKNGELQDWIDNIAVIIGEDFPGRFAMIEKDLSELKTVVQQTSLDEITDHAARLDALEIAVGALADAVRDMGNYEVLLKSLAMIFNGAQVARISNLGTFMIDEFTERGCGVALCHHSDQFNRKRGRIIAKGRLLKLLRAEI